MDEPVKAVPARIESVMRAARLLTSFTRERHTLTAKELAASAGVPLPSVYRYIATLKDESLLVGNDQGSYHLSARFTALARAADAAEGLVAIADQTMRELAQRTGETVLLVRLVGGAATCVHRIESDQRLRISYEPGQPLSLERGASGRILLASLDSPRRQALLDSLRRRDPERAEELEREVALAGQRGWATSSQEVDRGIWAAAAAISDVDRVVAVLSVPSPLIRASDPVREQILSQVRAAAAEISARIRSSAPETRGHS